MNVFLAGALRLTPLQAASTMFDAIKRFTVSYPTPKYLTLVKIVIFDMTIMESFRQCFLEQGSATGPDEQPVYSSSHRTSQGETKTQELGPPTSRNIRRVRNWRSVTCCLNQRMTDGKRMLVLDFPVRTYGKNICWYPNLWSSPLAHD